MTDPNLRMSDAERDQAAVELGEHYAQGRITVEEHGERLDRILAARTRGELGPVFADLPGSVALLAAPQAAPQAAPRRRRIRGLPIPLVMLVVLLMTVTVLAHLPLMLVGLGGWFLLSRRHCSKRVSRNA